MRHLLPIALLLTLGQASLHAALPEIGMKDHAQAFATTPAPDEEKYNFKFGNVTTDLIGTFSTEYNDNINQTTTGTLSDTILRFGVKSYTVWPITQLNSLSLKLDAGYRFYASHSELNSNHNFLDINPGSELALKWWVKNFEFKLYDQFQFSGSSTDTRVFNTSTSTVTSGNTELGQFMNRAGLETMWDLNDLKIYGGYARDDVRADRAAFRALDRTAHSVYLSPLFLVHPDFSLGLMSSYTWNDYRTNFQNDTRAWALGPTVYWQISANTSASGSLYWKSVTSKQTGTSGDTSETSNLNGSLRLTQDLNAFFSHSIELARTTDFGTATNATTLISLYYLPVYQLTGNIALKGRFGYEDGEDSPGPNQENYVRRVYGLGASYNVNQKLTTDLSYSYISQSSGIPERPYSQNRVMWEVNYDF